MVASLFIILRATMLPVLLHFAYDTHPYDPLPISSSTSYFLLIAPLNLCVIPNSSLAESSFTFFVLKEFLMLIFELTVSGSVFFLSSYSAFLVVTLVEAFDILTFSILGCFSLYWLIRLEFSPLRCLATCFFLPTNPFCGTIVKFPETLLTLLDFIINLLLLLFSSFS